MKDIKDAIKEVISAKSQTTRKAALKRVSKLFYWICRHEGLERTEILGLAAEIIGCFHQDIKNLREKVKEDN
jgi:hypothetical protein